MSPGFSYRNKYKIAAKQLADARGTLLDVGARDRVLSRVLGPQLAYASADAAPGCDYVIDLERPLPFADRQFDHVVALDVLEHVENIQSAFAQLTRIAAQRVVIALPNMAALSNRWHFLTRGRLNTRKYDLGPTHPGDRHRWLTIYPQINGFVECAAEASGFMLVDARGEADGTGVYRALSYALGSAHVGARGLWCSRIVYSLRRRE
jgi:hypothetical protein